MAIHFSIKPCPFGKKFDRERIKESVRASAIGAKAADAMTLMGLRRAVSDLEDEIMFQLCSIGELVYATHCGDPSDSDELQRILEYVDDLHDEIEGHEQQIKLLRGIHPCPVCGEDVPAGSVYCRECGQAMPVPPQT